GWLEHDFPHMTVNWRQLTSGSVVRDGMIAGTIQIGVVGTGPYLIGWAHDVPWKIISNVSDMDLWLCSKDPKIQSLKDIKPGMQIGMPAPDSTEGIALRKGAKDILGNAHALDTDIVAIAHPQGLSSLMNGQLATHFTSPPFEFEEVEQGSHLVSRSYEAFGQTRFTEAVMPVNFYQQYPDFSATFLGYMKRAINLIKSDPATAARYVAEAEGKPQLATQYKAWMTHKGITYTDVPGGFVKSAAFMKEIGMIDKAPTSVDQIEFPPLQKLGGS
ncbi:MAG: ABC transporter substrate-binding protein, partial [Vulcanimicrobiaceae bacterium]